MAQMYIQAVLPMQASTRLHLDPHEAALADRSAGGHPRSAYLKAALADYSNGFTPLTSEYLT